MGMCPICGAFEGHYSKCPNTDREVARSLFFELSKFKREQVEALKKREGVHDGRIHRENQT